MRLASFAAPALLLLADASPMCGSRPTPPPATQAPPPIVDAEAKEQAPARPPVTIEQLAALDDYAGFSEDGLLFAYTRMSAGAGLPVTSLLASTTNTVEKAVPLTGETARRVLMQELDAEGFPRPGQTPKPPSEVQATLRDGRVQVSFGPAPAAAPWQPFASTPGIEPTQAEVVAVSPDGQWIAVRVQGKNGGEFGPPVEYRVVKLFE